MFTAHNMGLPEPKEKTMKLQTFAKMQTQVNGPKDSDDEDYIESKRKPTI
jgi:hypothetical protein